MRGSGSWQTDFPVSRSTTAGAGRAGSTALQHRRIGHRTDGCRPRRNRPGARRRRRSVRLDAFPEAYFVRRSRQFAVSDRQPEIAGLGSCHPFPRSGSPPRWLPRRISVALSVPVDSRPATDCRGSRRVAENAANLAHRREVQLLDGFQVRHRINGDARSHRIPRPLAVRQGGNCCAGLIGPDAGKSHFTLWARPDF